MSAVHSRVTLAFLNDYSELLSMETPFYFVLKFALENAKSLLLCNPVSQEIVTTALHLTLGLCAKGVALGETLLYTHTPRKHLDRFKKWF